MKQLLLLVCFVAAVSFCYGANDLFTRYLLTEAAHKQGAVCLDGSPGAYYFKPGTGEGAKKWYIHHQGGGWCSSVQHCYYRSLGDLGSSKKYPPTMTMDGGYWSPDQRENPQMYNWNMVFMRYCDGGSFSGDNETLSFYDNKPVYFRGFRILKAIHDDLFNKRGLNAATDVVISGCSAGGLATYLHVDWWRENLSKDSYVVALPDSGFFLDYEAPGKDYRSEMKWTFEGMNAKGGVNAKCIEHYTPLRETWKCFFAQYTAPFIETPVFPLQSRFDAWQISNDLNSKNDAMINQYGKNLTELVQNNLLKPHPNNGIFLDSCFHHCGQWGRIHIDGKNQAEAFMGWYNKSKQKVYFQDKTYPCNDCCPSKFFYA